MPSSSEAVMLGVRERCSVIGAVLAGAAMMPIGRNRPQDTIGSMCSKLYGGEYTLAVHREPAEFLFSITTAKACPFSTAVTLKDA